MKLRCISLHQPWASAVAFGFKKIETRSRNTYVHGLIGIHAAKKRSNEFAKKFCDLCRDHPVIPATLGAVSLLDYYDHELPFGQIVAVAEIVDSVPVNWVAMNTLSPLERALGDYSTGRWIWPLTNIRRLANPIPASGRQGFFFVDVKRSQLKEAA